MNEIIGNETALRYIKEAVSENRILGTYLLEGAAGTGKLLLARYFAASVLCNGSDTAVPCKQCSVCERIFSGLHPDVCELTADDEKNQITVDEIREMVLSAQLTPTESDHKFYIIRPADKMNQQAQNALLKGIEEPPANVTYFLLADDVTALLPTVISRAYKIKTEELSIDEIQDSLSFEFPDESKENIKFASLLSSGSLGKAKLLLNDKEMTDARNTALSFMEAFSKGYDPISRSRFFAAGQRKDSMMLLLSMINLAARDVLAIKYASEATELMIYGSVNEVLKIANNSNGKAVAKLFDTTSELLRASNRNVNVTCASSVINTLM